jgi:nucleoside-diphosphate-sugar epimerase
MYNLDEVNLEQVFEENKIDYIIHCATDYGRKSVNPMRIIEANLLLPIKLLECGRKYGATAFINTDTILDKGINHYSLSKKQFRDWLMSYKNSLICINVELGHFYGPGDDTTKFVSFIVNKMVSKSESIDLTPGEQKRNFVYIDDVVSAFHTIIDHIPKLDTLFYEFQVCGKQEISIKEVVILIQKVSGNTETKLCFGALPYRENEAMTSKCDNTAIQSLGWAEKYTLQEGIHKTLEAELIQTPR